MSAPSWAYADSSVLVKRYVHEPASVEAGRLTSLHALVTSALSSLEVVSALFAKHRAGTLSAPALNGALNRHSKEKGRWTIVEISPLVLGRAEDVLRQVSARTADAIHIASALFFNEVTGASLPFMTADHKQRASAEALGLPVVWIGARVRQSTA